MTEITNKVAPCHYVLSYVPKTMKALWEKLCGFSKVFPTNFISAILSANVCTKVVFILVKSTTANFSLYYNKIR